MDLATHARLNELERRMDELEKLVRQLIDQAPKAPEPALEPVKRETLTLKGTNGTRR